MRSERFRPRSRRCRPAVRGPRSAVRGPRRWRFEPPQRQAIQRGDEPSGPLGEGPRGEGASGPRGEETSDTHGSAPRRKEKKITQVVRGEAKLGGTEHRNRLGGSAIPEGAFRVRPQN